MPEVPSVLLKLEFFKNDHQNERSGTNVFLIEDIFDSRPCRTIVDSRATSFHYTERKCVGKNEKNKEQKTLDCI